MIAALLLGAVAPSPVMVPPPDQIYWLCTAFKTSEPVADNQFFIGPVVRTDVADQWTRDDVRRKFAATLENDDYKFDRTDCSRYADQENANASRAEKIELWTKDGETVVHYIDFNLD